MPIDHRRLVTAGKRLARVAGAHLARLELRVILRELLLRAPTFHVRAPVGFRHLDLGFARIVDGFDALHLELDDA